MNGEGDMFVKDSSFMLFGKKIPVSSQIQANSSTMVNTHYHIISYPITIFHVFFILLYCVGIIFFNL